MSDYSFYTDEQLIEEYNNLINHEKEQEKIKYLTQGFARKEIERELKEIREKKSYIISEITKRGIENSVLDQ